MLLLLLNELGAPFVQETVLERRLLPFVHLLLLSKGRNFCVPKLLPLVHITRAVLCSVLTNACGGDVKVVQATNQRSVLVHSLAKHPA